MALCRAAPGRRHPPTVRLPALANWAALWSTCAGRDRCRGWERMVDGNAERWIDFAGPLRTPSPLRKAITAATRRPEPECLPTLVEAATLAPEAQAAVALRTRKLVAALRAKGARGPVESLIQEYSLSSQEGVALMCLAEALLRI